MRKTIRKHLLIILVGSLFAITSVAQTVHDLNSISSMPIQGTGGTIIPVPQEVLKEAKASRTFAVNPALQKAGSVKVGDIVNLQLFEDKNYSSTVSRQSTNVNGNFSLTLKLPDYPMAFGYITTSTKGKSLFFVYIPELNQKFSSRTSDQADYLIELADNVEIPLINDEMISPVEKPENEYNNQETSQAPVNIRSAMDCTRDPNLTGTDPATLKVFIAYTSQAETWAASQGGIQNIIDGAMLNAQNVLDNQQNGDQIVLAGSVLVVYTEDPDTGMNDDLNYLTSATDGVMDEVHQLRKQSNADIVSLFVSNNITGGLGWVLNNDVNGQYQNAFNAVRVQQASWGYTLIHEIGHNMGMHHEKDQYTTLPTPLYSYAWGWYWQGNSGTTFGSVMSYTGTDVPYYSNPNETYDGVFTGTATANNAQVFRNTKHVVAFYSDKLNNLPEAPENIVVSNPTNNGATFSWDKSNNASTYRFLAYQGGSWWGWPDVTNTSYTVSDIDFLPGTTYQFYIRAFNECGDIVNSQILTFTTKTATDPTVTTGTTVNSITHNSATVTKSISNPSSIGITEDGFMYKEAIGGVWQPSPNGNLTGLTPNTQYKFYGYVKVSGNTINGLVQTFTTAAGDNTPPQLSAGSVTRTSDIAATIDFTTDEAGTAYYLVLASGATAPSNSDVKTLGTSLGVVEVGANTSKAVTLTAGARDIYVVVEDAAGNISAPLKIETNKQGDINGDKAVNALDMNILLSNFGLSGPAINLAADLNKDDAVNALDMNILLTNFGK